MRPSRSPHLARFLPILLLSPLRSLAQQQANTDCHCWQTSLGEDSPLTFLHYEFHDYRAVPAEGDNNWSNAPPEIQADQGQGNELATAEFFTTDEFRSSWVIQNWSANTSRDAPVKRVNSAGNIYISKDDPSAPDTHLSLRTMRLPDFQSTAEIVTAADSLEHASVRVRARVRGSAGAVAGLFFYYDDDNESDTEIRTRDAADSVQLTNHPGTDDEGNVVPEANSEVQITPSGDWTDWQTYRLDWAPERSEWLINNVSVAQKTYGVPKEPSHFHINAWSNGGQWSGNMSEGDQVVLDVQWVELAYNLSGGDPAAVCERTCGVDGQTNLEAARVDVPAGSSDEGAAAGRMAALGWGAWGAWLLGVGLMLA